MHVPRFAAVSLLAMSSLALLGAKPATSAPARTWSLDTSPLGDCKKSDNVTVVVPTKSDILGVIRIRLPKNNFSFDKLNRHGSNPDVKVNYKKGAYDVDAGGDDDEGTPGETVNGPDDTSMIQPFDIYYKLSKLSIAATDRKDHFFLVKVIIKDNANYNFYTDATVQGIGKDKSNSAVCGTRKVDVPPKAGKHIAQFYIRADQIPVDPMTAPRSFGFNIVVAPNSATQTPIIIDPKIYNEG